MNRDEAEERTTKYTKHTKMKINHASPGGANEANKEGRSFSDSFVTFVIFCSQPFRVFGVFRGSASGSVSFVSLWFNPFRVFRPSSVAALRMEDVFRGSQKFFFSAFLCANLCSLCVEI